jgi:hypothetical protein
MTPEEQLVAELRYMASRPNNTGSACSLRHLKRMLEHYDKGTDSPYIKYLAAEDEAYEINKYRGVETEGAELVDP